ncbi:alpha/beta fold hydrolase [Marinobacteraceae bacterium S3BR75-40.1]
MSPAQAAMVAPSFVEEVVPVYRAKCRNIPCDQRLARWRPQPRGLGAFRQWALALLPRVRREQNLIGGQKLVHWEMGPETGETVVLLHGFGASKENWLFLAPKLAQHYRVLIPDVPGFGESDFRAKRCYAADNQVTRLAAWLVAASPHPVHLVGSSMGGALAGLLTARHPEMVTSLTLMNAAGVSGGQRSDFEKALLEGRNLLVPRRYGDVSELLLLATERRRQWLSRCLTPFIGPDMVRRHWVNHRLFNDLLNSETQPHEVLSRIRRPTFILWGDRDRILDVSCVHTLHGLIGHAQSTVFSGVGHLPMLEVPTRTAETLTAFWRQQTH